MKTKGKLNLNNNSFYDNVIEPDCLHMTEFNLPNSEKEKTQETKEMNETKDKLEVETHVYKRRWYILMVFSLFTASQCSLWNTWGPISTSSELAFDWSDSTIAWMTNWGPIAYCVGGLIFPWIMQVKGLRWAVLPSIFLVFLGSCFRIITSDTEVATILIHIGQFMNGLAGPMAMAGVTGLSATWFPPKERFTSTSIMVSLCIFGGGLSFVVGPAIVSMTTLDNVTSSSNIINNISMEIRNNQTAEVSLTHSNTSEKINEIKEQIMLYMYCECGWCCFVFLLILLYFPSKPNIPPSVSASKERDDYWSGIWSLRKNPSYVLVAIVFGVSTGVVAVWSALLNVNLRPSNISETEAGWIGFYCNISGCITSVIVGRFADIFAQRVKMYIMIFFLIGTLCFTLLALMLIGKIEFSSVLLYITAIGGVCLINSTTPLLYEFSCELSYPTSEMAANGVLAMLNNIAGVLFLIIFAFPDVGSMWMNWAVIGCVAACIPMLALSKSRFKRLEVDEKVNLEAIADQQISVVATDP